MMTWHLLGFKTPEVLQWPRLQAQEYYINYNYKSNSQEYIQSIIKYINSIHIVINVLELAFQSHEGVGTEDLYLTQTLDHGRRLWRVQSSPIWSCKGRRRTQELVILVWVSFHSFLFSPLQENKFRFSIPYHLRSFYTTGEEVQTYP